MQRQCAQCGKPFEAQRSTAKFCGSTCRSYSSRSGPPPPPPTDPQRPTADLIDAVRAELEALGKADAVVGRHAIELANRMVAAPVMNTGVAALSRELSRVLDEARGTVAATASNPFDELKSRRDRRRAG